MINLESRILITGAKGQLGSDCMKTFLLNGFKNVLGIDRDDLDLTLKNNVSSFLDNYKPDLIIHCAAWTSVDLAESHKKEVYLINSEATKYLSCYCGKNNIPLLYISTDYVFDGKGEKPFEINDKKHGLSIYGKSKSLGEDYVLEMCKKYFIVRISWVFGLNGNNFIKTVIKLSDRGDKIMNVVNDQIGSPTYTVDLSQFLLKLISTDKFGIYHAPNDGYCSWADLARLVVNEIGSPMKICEISSDDYLKLNPLQAKRPLNSRMSTKCLEKNGFCKLPTWQDAAKRYIHEELGR